MQQHNVGKKLDERFDTHGLLDRELNIFVDFTPILMLDMWEHAFYLQYKNVKADYVEAWWNVVNWDDVNQRYAKAAA